MHQTRTQNQLLNFYCGDIVRTLMSALAPRLNPLNAASGRNGRWSW
jgi:hypothetical protein